MWESPRHGRTLSACHTRHGCSRMCGWLYSRAMVHLSSEIHRSFWIRKGEDHRWRWHGFEHSERFLVFRNTEVWAMFSPVWKRKLPLRTKSVDGVRKWLRSWEMRVSRLAIDKHAVELSRYRREYIFISVDQKFHHSWTLEGYHEKDCKFSRDILVMKMSRERYSLWL